MVTSDLVRTAVQFGVIPLDAQAGVEAVMKSGIGEMIQFALLMMCVALSVGSLFALGAAGLSHMSQDAGRQSNVSKYLASSGIMLATAAVLGASPEILQAIGFETFEYISPVNVFS